ncbi:BglG family transcription antiterminator [Streptococcus merionis]|uniref:Transcriptional antiterminator n=1 Tax=Streptococcus merionis TaxID=400065 RepID=A0A239SR57_9STRE|nr:BglG family transcription antiterminator [Streptococcus merionis]SNU87955.1 transcriptional antiterminator [Streptococcus merionis]
MNKKQEQLLQLLSEHTTLTASALAHYLSVSVRTVKNYVKEINEEFPNTVISSHSGYSIANCLPRYIFQEQTSNQTVEERHSHILIKILSAERPVDAFDLADDLFVSYSTLQTDLRKIRKQLTKFNLSLILKNNQLTVGGSEKDKRKLISNLLYNQSHIHFMNYSTIQSLFPDIDIAFLKTVTLEILEKYHYFINDYSLINFIMHLSIMINRIMNHNISLLHHQTFQLPETVSHICQSLSEKIESRFGILLSDADQAELAILLLSRTTRVDYRNSNSQDIEKYIGDEARGLVDIILQQLDTLYLIQLNDNSEFILRFSIHIKNLLTRARNNYLNKNPLVDNIKLQSPLIYDISVTIASIIKNQAGLSINDDEIAYIAFHLGSLIESQQELVETTTVILYSPDYYQSARTLATQLSEHFGNRLFIKNIVNDEEQILNDDSSDLIIATVPVNKEISIPILLITPFFHHRDKEKLSKKLDNLIFQRKRKEFETNLRDLFSADLFEITTEISDKEKAISHMCKILYDRGYTQSDFEQKIIEREKLSSTAFDRFAIPHTMTMEAKKTGIFFLINRKGIVWSSKKIQLVIMLCFSSSNRTTFHQIFEPLTNILIEPQNFEKIINSKHYEECVEYLVSCYRSD